MGNEKAFQLVMMQLVYNYILSFYSPPAADVYVATAGVADPLCGSFLKNKRHRINKKLPLSTRLNAERILDPSYVVPLAPA